MRTLLLAGCLLLSALAAQPQSEFDGKWLWQGPGGWQRVSLDLKSKGTELAGTITLGPEAVPPGKTVAPDAFWRLYFVPVVFEIADGKVVGNQISFQHEPPVGSQSRISYTGAFTGNTLKLTRRYSRRSEKIAGDPQVEFMLEREPLGFRQGVSGRASSEALSLTSLAAQSQFAQTRAVDVSVTNTNGQIVSNLGINDFVLEEAGEARRIQHLDSVDSPWNLLLLMEHRSLTTRMGAASVARAIEPFLSRLRSQDRILIAAFDQKVETLVNWRSFPVGEKRSADLSPAFRSFGGSPGAGGFLGTDLYGAMKWATAKMNGVRGRKAVIVLTEGRDARLVASGFRMPGSQMIIDPLFGLPDDGEITDFETTLQIVRQSGIRFHFLAINPKDSIDQQINPLYPGAREGIDDSVKLVGSRIVALTKSSGGQALYSETPSDAFQRFGSLFEDLRLGSSYTLEYQSNRPAVVDQNRRIEVRAGNSAFRVHSSEEGVR